MMGKTHMAAGVAAGAGLALVCNAKPDHAAALIAASFVGSLVPDLDGAQSTGSHLLFKASPICGLLFFALLAPKSEGLRACVTNSVLFALSIASFPILTAILLPHRGPTHSVLLWLLALLATLLLVPYG
ncbi:MAG: metal-dependent hydrolase, partial [Blastocatellia bacterium]